MVELDVVTLQMLYLLASQCDVNVLSPGRV